jgi:hypothetical protein
MKQTLTLTIFVLNLLGLCASQTAAQSRGRLEVQSTKAEKKIAATKISDVSAPVPVNQPAIMAVAGNTIKDLHFDGTADNFHVPKYQGMMMDFVGFAFGPNGKLYGLTSSTLTNGYNSVLFVIAPNSGPQQHETLQLSTPLVINGNRWDCAGDGDLAYDKGGELYATCKDNGVWKLVTINRFSGEVTFIGSMPGGGGSFSALAFNSLGDLFALDTQNRKLWKLNKSNPSSNPQLISLVAAVGQLPASSTQGGMGFIGESGLYAFFGGHLVTINPLTGTVTTIFNNNNGFVSGLAVSGGGYVQHN